MTGFDGAGHLAGVPTTRDAIDIAAYGRCVDADDAAAREAGIACVREAIDWRCAERADAYDFATLRIRIAIARQAGVQIAWTLCHSSWPDDVDFASPATIERFARAAAVAIADADGAHAPPYTPVSEISFLACALAETSLFGPPREALRERAPQLQRALVQAALAACDAILAVDPRARFLHTEPVLHAPVPGDAAGASEPTVRQEPWDTLTGRLEPQLGGHPRYVDAIGVRFHQGHRGRRRTVERGAESTAGIGLARLLADVHARHGQPIIVAETSAGGSARAVWMRDFGRELCEALESGIPVIGACLCRVAERPAWEDPRLWRARRLWDALLRSDTSPVVDSAYAQALRDVQARVDPLLAPANRRYLS
jgi:UDP-galactopyranose mutase